ncbi:MAG: TIGR04283 family arsenosugar biosynthesis glycosyltransferase [Thermoanaerobaculia bacterium]|nr:TIGR04283 family arsenosugar biosynthesis glycosyltransferase [Thermoanaerobaculia bacterium]
MTARIAVVIPTLNEESSLERAIASARETDPDEIVVSDGGSGDRTLEIAGRCGARVIASERMRARQMNGAARSTSAEALLFLHADTVLPPEAGARIREAIDDGFAFGGFRIRFTEDDLRLRIAAAMINFRTSMTRCPWGDQAQFVTRERFDLAGGYPEMPIMEDYEFARRMKALGGVTVLRERVSTSGRRFLQRGVLATAAMNWRIILSYHLGASPEDLRRLYGSR